MESLLRGLYGVPGIEFGSTACLANALPAVLLLWPQILEREEFKVPSCPSSAQMQVWALWVETWPSDTAYPSFCHMCRKAFQDSALSHVEVFSGIELCLEMLRGNQLGLCGPGDGTWKLLF